ncbi:MAG: NAD(P)-dependent oxidoreductase, partial [Gammaproteobacteria bacterium]|nr:NAD(P)-dependent oxidoreductase [Gammaproteobacteria bacterium]
LLDDGHEVTVWNRTAAKAEALVVHGAKFAAEAAGVCSPHGLVMSCLADDAALEAVFEDGSVLQALGSGGIHLSMSTISAACAARQAKRHGDLGVAYLAVPICGRPDAVKARRQSFLIAGDAAAKARVLGTLEALGRRVFDFGEDPSAANVAKISFNFLIVSAVEAMAEVFAVIEKSGLDVETFHEMIIGTAFGCPLYEGYGRQLHQQAWDVAGFRLALGLKDVKLVAETAAACGARMRLGELLLNRFESAVAKGLSDKDWTAIAEEIRAEAGL